MLKRHKRGKTHAAKSLVIDDLVGVFAVLVIGWSLSVVAFVAEIAYRKYRETVCLSMY